MEKSLLWKIERDNLENPSYLFGTIHLIPKKEIVFPSYMINAFNSCEELVLELNLNEISFSEKKMLFQHMMLPSGLSYRDYLNDSSFQALKLYLVDTMKIKERKVNKYFRIKPVYTGALILSELVKNPKSYEEMLTKKAKRGGISISGLETFQEQLEIIDSYGLTDQFIELEKETRFLQEYEKLLNSYLSEDIYSLYNMMKEDSGFSNFENTYLIQRNRNWIATLEKTMVAKSVFFAVGCGHLAGENGLIQLLRDRGYSVTPVNE
ncbi:TraB/GumN family protein [Bacteroidota bacterium]